MGFELVLFIALGGLSVLFAVGMLISKNAVHSALFLIGNFACVAVLYLLLDAPFIAMVQIVVYTGAIMVLFLFVIMLLGAEQTTDTTRGFRWLTGLATTAAIALLVAMGAPLVIGGVNLPIAEGGDPQIRIAHGANVTDNPAVIVTLRGTETLTSEPLRFGDVTNFFTVPAGDYTVILNREDGSVVAPPAQVTLGRGQVVTAVAYGEVNLEAGTFPSVALVPVRTTSESNSDTLLNVVNAYSNEPLTLVDLGANKVLDTRSRAVLDDKGADTGATITTLDDAILAVNAGLGTPVSASYATGKHTLAFVNSRNEIIFTLFDYELKRNTEQLIILAPDVEQPAGLDGGVRPRVLRNASLTTPTTGQYGSPAGIGFLLFTDYLLPMNIVGFLLLVAMVGAIVLTRPDADTSQRRVVARRKVSRPLTSVITQQTGSDVLADAPQLDAPQPANGD